MGGKLRPVVCYTKPENSLDRLCVVCTDGREVREYISKARRKEKEEIYDFKIYKRKKL